MMARFLLLTLVLGALGAVLLLPAHRGRAAFPGANGKITFTNFSLDSNALIHLDIYMMNPDGTGVTRLTNSATQDGAPAWSPDGSKIAFHRVDPEGNTSDVYVMNADGSGATALGAGGYDPAWSPDGTKIAFARDSDIYVMNADGSGQTDLTNDAEPGDGAPAWSPDGSKIAFQRIAPYGTKLNIYVSDIYVMNADGSGAINLTNNPGLVAVGDPNWAPDGTKIAFTHDSAIYVMNADGSGQTSLSTQPDSLDAHPAWSPDGTKIAFALYTGEFSSEIDVMNADGSGRTRLTDIPAADVDPDWQPFFPRTGDVNCGGDVDSIDAALVLQFTAALVSSLACEQNADVNHDGEANSIDAALILQYTAGLLAHWPP